MTCRRCGEPGTETIVTREGIEMGRGILCDPCLAQAVAIADDNREIFESLIASGVTRERANEMMIARLYGQGADA